MDIDSTCPMCGQDIGQAVDCAAIWPTSAADVVPVRCRLPEGHHPRGHWHPPLWPGTGDLIWFDDDLPAGQAVRRRAWAADG